MQNKNNYEVGLTEENAAKLHSNLVKHIVGLRWIDKTPGERGDALGGTGTPMLISGFIISVNEQWFWVSAGHIFKDIENALRNGQILEEFHFDDAFNSLAPHRSREAMIPYDFKNSSHFYLDSEFGDYAIILLSPLYVELFKSNGISPIPEEYVHSFEGFDHYWVVGLPTELMQTIGSGETSRMNSELSFIALDRLFDLPPEIAALHAHKHGEYFYGRLPDPEDMVDEGTGLDDIDGLSGGPIFGVVEDPNKGFGYALVGVQSGWFRRNRIIFGCGMVRVINAIERTMASFTVQLAESIDSSTLEKPA